MDFSFDLFEENSKQNRNEAESIDWIGTNVMETT